MFLNARLAQIFTGALRAKDVIHLVPSLRSERVLYRDQCSPERFCWPAGDGEVVGMQGPGYQFRYSLHIRQGSPRLLAGLATGVLGTCVSSMTQGTFYAVEWVAIGVEEPTQLGFLFYINLFLSVVSSGS